MNPAWFKSVSARIEGRNVTIGLGLLFCGALVWQLDRTYRDHSTFSGVLISLLLALAAGVILVGLLVKPRPTDVTPRTLIRQFGPQQMIFVAGMQSHEELVALLRAAHNIEDLPPPAALIEGTASNQADYRDLSPERAAEIAEGDRDQVTKKLRDEAARIIAALIPENMPTQRIGEIKRALESLREPPSDSRALPPREN